MFKKQNIFLIINFTLLALLIIKGYFLYKTLGVGRTGFEDIYNEKIKVSGFVCSEAELDYRFRRFVLCAEKKILVTTNLYPEYNYGDNLVLEGRLQKPVNFSDFNYIKYLAGKDIYALFYYPSIEYEKKDNLLVENKLTKRIY